MSLFWADRQEEKCKIKNFFRPLEEEINDNNE
jgi:hypothetical protein